MKREDVEALLTLANLAGLRQRECAVPSDTLAALCRAWLAVEDAEICTVVDSSWHEWGVIHDISPELVGQRVRIVPEQGEGSE